MPRIVPLFWRAKPVTNSVVSLRICTAQRSPAGKTAARRARSVGERVAIADDAPVNHLLPILVFGLLIGAYYVLISRKRTPGVGWAFLLVIIAAFPLLDGGLLLFREYGRWQQGRVAPGVVVGKLSSTGADGSPTIGGRRHWRASRSFPYVMTSDGFRLHDVLARMMLTGSPNAWIVEYRYPCASSGDCRQREAVSHALWSRIRVGQTVNVRSAKGQDDPGRLDDNPLWSTGLAKLAIGGTLGVLAGLVSGRLTLRRRRKYVTAPAVVTSVDPVTSGGEVHWRVGFAYVCPDGTACESTTVVYVSGLQPGDECIAVYPPSQPALATLRVTERVPARALSVDPSTALRSE
jgi:hypothetical protein